MTFLGGVYAATLLIPCGLLIHCIREIKWKRLQNPFSNRISALRTSEKCSHPFLSPPKEKVPKERAPGVPLFPACPEHGRGAPLKTGGALSNPAFSLPAQRKSSVLSDAQPKATLSRFIFGKAQDCFVASVASLVSLLFPMAAKPPFVKSRSDFMARRGTMGMNRFLAVFFGRFGSFRLSLRSLRFLFFRPLKILKTLQGAGAGGFGPAPSGWITAGR